MRNKRNWLRFSIVLLFFSVYVASLVKMIHEQDRRSLKIKEEVVAGDCVHIAITVTGADPVARRLTARLRLRLSGDIAQDPETSKVNLRLHVNNFPGQQVFEFPKGERMTRIEATFPMDGEQNQYPFDRYVSDLGLSVTTPRPISKSQTPKVRADEPADKLSDDHDLAGLDLGESELERTVPIPLAISLSASTAGIKYGGEVIRSEHFGITRVRMNLSRPYNVINISVTVMFLMMGLAVSVLVMVLKAMTPHAEFEALPLSLCITLIFGLPALRNMQPGVPPVGVLGDYFSFIWAELIVGAAGIIMALTWVLRTRSDSTSKDERET